MTELQTGGRQAEAAATYKIASIPADGVGKEVIAAGRKVLDFVAEQSNGKFAFQWDDFDWGSEYYARTGRMMAEDGLETLKNYDAIYFGAVGWANVPDHISLWGLRLNITQNFDLWANVRPVKFHPGIQSPLRKADDTELDWVVVRENSEGEYAGLGGRNLSGRGPGNEVALQTALFTEKGCERILRFAFDLARARTVKKVSSVTKSNAQQYGMVLWDETLKRVAKYYPDVATERARTQTRLLRRSGGAGNRRSQACCTKSGGLQRPIPHRRCGQQWPATRQRRASKPVLRVEALAQRFRWRPHRGAASGLSAHGSTDPKTTRRHRGREEKRS